MSANQTSDYQQFKANTFSFMINRETTELAPSKINYDGEMKRGFLFLNIHLNYVNNSDAPDNNAVFILPTNNFQMLCEVECQINKRNAKLDIREILEEQKKKINETSQDVISLGYQYFKINIGTFSKGSNCDIDIKLNIISTNTDERTYQTVIPISKTKPLGENNFSFKIKYSKMSVSDSILCGDEAEIENIDYDFDCDVFTINQYLSVPIIIETELIGAIQNAVESGMNNEYFIISVLPKFSNKTPKNDFVFVADCSGSMSGDRIRNVSNCLLNYLPSLAADCKFNIIRFGSNYECIFKEGRLVENNPTNFKIAKDAVANMQADMGGTNLYEPLVEAYRQSEQSTREGKIVQIFTLTDGGIHDKERVFQLVGSHSTTHHINSIGVGAGVSNDLVEGLATHSKGNCKFVSKPDDIKEVVMDLLNATQNSTISNPSIKLVGSDGRVLINTKLNGELRSGQMINIFVKKNNSNRNVSIKETIFSGKVENEEIKTNIGEIKENPRLDVQKATPIKINRGDLKKQIDEIKEIPPERKMLVKTMDGLIQSQTSDGFWSDLYVDQLIEFLKESYNYKNFEKKLKMMLCSIDAYRHNDQTNRGDVQATVIALCIFNIAFKSSKKFWKLVSRKAVEWLESQKLNCLNVFALVSLFKKKKRTIDGDFFEYDFDYEDYRCQVLYVTNHKDDLSEHDLRNLFSRFATINSIRIMHDEKNMCYALVTLSSYTEAKELVNASLLMKYNEKPIYVSFQSGDVRFHYNQNYKYMIYQKIKDNIPLNTVLSEISQHQARALMHDPDLFDDWINLSWYSK